MKMIMTVTLVMMAIIKENNIIFLQNLTFHEAEIERKCGKAFTGLLNKLKKGNELYSYMQNR